MIHGPRMQDPKFELHWMADSERRHSSVGYRKTTEEISAFTGIPVQLPEKLCWESINRKVKKEVSAFRGLVEPRPVWDPNEK